MELKPLGRSQWAMHRRVWFACISALVLLGGCGAPSPIGGRDREVFYAAIVSLSPSTTELTSPLLATTYLKGRTESCNFPEFMMPQVAVVMEGMVPNLERIQEVIQGAQAHRRLAPDTRLGNLVLYDPLVVSEATVNKIKELGFDTFPVRAGNLEEYRASVRQLGSLLAAEIAASEFLDRLDREIERGRAAVTAADKKLSTAILMGKPAEGEYWIAGLQSFQADLVRASGGDPRGPEADRFVPANVESLVGLNPDVILSDGNREAILRDPRLASITAVRNQHVYDVNPDVLLRAGGRVPDAVRAIVDLYELIRQEKAGQAEPAR